MACSTVSTLYSNVVCSVSNHALVWKCLRGVFNRYRWTTFARTGITWDVDVVLHFWRSDLLKIAHHSWQLKLSSCVYWDQDNGGQAIWLRDLRNISWTNSDVHCRFGNPLKTSTPRNHQSEIVFGVFPSGKVWCGVKYLRHYVKRTEELRGTDTRLFISMKAPHKAVGRDTVRRWTEMGLQKAGIDMSIFTPHLTIAASTSKAVQKVPLKMILQQFSAKLGMWGEFFSPLFILVRICKCCSL